MLDRSLLDKLPLRGQKSGTDTIGKNLEEGNGVLNVLEVGGDLEPSAEAPQFVKLVLLDVARKCLNYVVYIYEYLTALGSARWPVITRSCTSY